MDQTSQNPAVADGKKKEKTPMTPFDVLEAFILALVAVILVFTSVCRITIVYGESMESTLYAGDALVVSRAHYTPKNGDIVVIHQPTPAHPEPLIKRVIAVGGQTIDIDFNTWTVTVDGQVIEEDYMLLKTDRRITSDYTYPMEIPEGYVFVMGDNRNHSADSRSINVGLIDERSILGRVILRIAPLDRFGSVK